MNEIKQKMPDGSERILQISMPFDKRNSDPKKNYGIGSMFFRMVYLKNNNATQFTFAVPFYLPNVAQELLYKKSDSLIEGMGFDVGYHADKPQFDGQSQANRCDLIAEGKCYYDGSSLAAKERYEEFIRHENAFDWAWEQLSADWQERFNNS